MVLRRLLQYLCLLGLWLVQGSVQASSVQVNPVRINLNQEHRIESLVISNSADQAIILQLESVRWQQQDGADVFSVSRDILATPPLVQIPARSSQIVRIGLRQFTTSPVEQSYRLFLHEVLPDTGEAFQGLRVALKISLPIFIQGNHNNTASALWQAQLRPNRQVELSLYNQGNQHIQLLKLSVTALPANKQQELSLSQYVLPQQQARWLLPLQAAQPSIEKIQIHALTDQGELIQTLTVNP